MSTVTLRNTEAEEARQLAEFWRARERTMKSYTDRGIRRFVCQRCARGNDVA